MPKENFLDLDRHVVGHVAVERRPRSGKPPPQPPIPPNSAIATCRAISQPIIQSRATVNKSSMLALGRRLFGWSRSRWWSRKARKPRVRFSECVFLYLSNIDNPYSNPTEILYTIAPNVAFGALHPITTKLFAEFCPPRNSKFCKGAALPPSTTETQWREEICSPG